MARKYNSHQMSIDGIIASLYFICQFTINEMERGYYQLGSFAIKVRGETG